MGKVSICSCREVHPNMVPIANTGHAGNQRSQYVPDIRCYERSYVTENRKSVSAYSGPESIPKFPLSTASVSMPRISIRASMIEKPIGKHFYRVIVLKVTVYSLKESRCGHYLSNCPQLALQPRQQICFNHWPGKIETLHFITAQLAQNIRLLACFNPFCQHGPT